MGFKLFIEVRDYAPASLTHREKLTALILADDAKDESRLTFSSVVDPVIMERAMIKTERDMRKVLARLVETGVLENVVSGRKGAIAKYRFLPLAPAGALDDLPTPKEVLSGPPMEEVTDAKEVLFGPPNGPIGGPFRHQRRSNLDLPTPLTPSISSSSSDAAPAPHGEEDEEKISDKGKTDNPVADLGVEAAIRHIVDRNIGIDRDGARVIVDSITASMLKRGETVSFWDRYIRRFTDEQLHQRLTDATRARVRGRIITDLPGCGECNPQRRLEDSEGNDMGPCPTCTPAARPAPSADENERIAQ